MLERWFIYVLRDPISADVRYVGKTWNITGRLCDHLKNAKRGRFYSERWIAGLLKCGRRPTLEVIDAGRGDGHAAAERAWIAEHRRRGARLTNITDGGEGVDGLKHSKETLEKIAATRRSWSPERRAEHSAVMSAAKSNPHDETRRKLAAANVGKRHAPATLAKMSATRTGRTHSEEHKANIRDALVAIRDKTSARMKGRKQSPESIANMAAAKRGVPKSEEHRRKMSEARLGVKRGSPSEETRQKKTASE